MANQFVYRSHNYSSTINEHIYIYPYTLKIKTSVLEIILKLFNYIPIQWEISPYLLTLNTKSIFMIKLCDYNTKKKKKVQRGDLKSTAIAVLPWTRWRKTFLSDVGTWLWRPQSQPVSSNTSNHQNHENVWFIGFTGGSRQNFHHLKLVRKKKSRK